MRLLMQSTQRDACTWGVLHLYMAGVIIRIPPQVGPQDLSAQVPVPEEYATLLEGSCPSISHLLWIPYVSSASHQVSDLKATQ